MGKHSRRNDNVVRRTAVASAVTLGAAAALTQPAQAAEVVVPNTDIRFEVAGLENVPNLAAIPGVAQYVPGLQGQAAAAPYVWGATGPNAFDCSGLTSWAYAQVGKHIPRTSYAQAAQGTPVSRDALRPGDIVAFYSGASHVGIYTGHGTVIHAINEGTPLSESSLDYMPFHSAVRF